LQLQTIPADIRNRAKGKLPMTNAENIDKLKLFNEMAETLLRRDFITQVFRPNHGVTLQFHSDKPLTYEKRGATEEAILAVVASLRFFVQDRDGISFGQMADIYECLPVEEKAKQSARHAADSFESYFASPAGFTIDGMSITNKRLFDVFMYGKLVHANADKKREYEKWMNHHSAVAPLLWTTFEQIVATTIQVIISYRAMNTRTIQQLQGIDVVREQDALIR
jgi:hypothetical protein